MQFTVLLPRSNLFEALEVRHLTFAVTFASSDVPDIAMVDYYLMIWLYLLFVVQNRQRHVVRIRMWRMSRPSAPFTDGQFRHAHSLQL